MGLRLPLGARPAEAASRLRVLTCNVHRQHLDAGEFKALLEEIKPDVVALQDWSSAHEAELFREGEWICRREGELFVASRQAILDVRPIALGASPATTWKVRDGAAMYCQVQTPLGAVGLINLHLSSPHRGLQALRELESDAPEQLQFNSRTRDQESNLIAEFAQGVPGPLIILGDFNTPPESPIYREHWGGLLDAFDARGFGFGITHVSTASSVRLDHILLGPGLDVRRCWLGDAAGSPHRPLVADLQPARALAPAVAAADR
jgi:endonuclease/exonuclease/phosphatase family metal-dependent hydrolase